MKAIGQGKGPAHICPLCGTKMKQTKGGEYNAKCMSCGYEVACCDTD